MKPEQAQKLTQAKVLEAAGAIPPDHHHCATLAVFTLQEAVLNGLLPPKKSWWQRIKALFS
jgi:hypothetical protein